MYDCEWGFRYLWRWMDWLGRADIIALALMLLCVIVIFGRGLYRCYLTRHQTRTFIRDAASALHSGAFSDASRLAGRTSVSPVAAMVVTWVATVGSDSEKTLDLTESTGVAWRAFWRCQRNLNAKFIFGLGTLKSIAHTAPFLGLAGACELILNGAFRGFAMEKHAAMLMLTSGIATSLVATLTGLAAAIPAAWSYNYLRQRIEMLDNDMSQKALDMTTKLNAHLKWPSPAEHTILGPKWHNPLQRVRGFQFAQSQPLRKRFSDIPAYALLAAPGLAFAVAAFMIFPSFYAPTGLSVRLLKPGEGVGEQQFVPAVVIRSAGTGSNRQSALYVNAKETSLEKLRAVVKGELGINSQRVTYVEAEGDVSWQTVANAIDVVKGVPANVALLTIAPTDNRTRIHGFRTPLRRLRVKGR